MTLVCDVCKESAAEHRCALTRQVGVCSVKCFSMCSEQHAAAIALCFCGGVMKKESLPNFGAWESADWMSKGDVSESRWNSLRSATPQGDQLH